MKKNGMTHVSRPVPSFSSPEELSKHTYIQRLMLVIYVKEPEIKNAIRMLQFVEGLITFLKESCFFLYKRTIRY